LRIKKDEKDRSTLVYLLFRLFIHILTVVHAQWIAGEEVKKEGGLFGIGAKEEAVPKGDAMKKLLNESRDKAVAAYNVRVQFYLWLHHTLCAFSPG